MKKVLIGAGALLVLLVIAALAAPSFVDWNAYRPQLIAAAKEATGRDLAVDGGLDLSLLPTPELSATGVRLASIPGAAEPDMVRIEELEVRVALLPLLSGDVKVESVRLVKPTIVLEELEDGRANWNFAPSGPAAQPTGEAGEGSADGFALSLEDVEVRDATIVYRSARTGAAERIEGLSFEGSAGSLRGPFVAKGELTRGSLPIRFEASLGALQADRPAPLHLAATLEGRGATLSFDGSLAGVDGDLRIAGGLEAAAEDLARGRLQSSSPLLAQPLALEAAIDASAAAASANDLNLRFGETQAGGAVSLAFGASPRFDATLSATRIDLDALLATGQEPTAPGRGDARGAPAASGAAPDFALPPSLSGALAASVEGIVYRGAVIWQAQLDAEISDGRLTVKRLAALLPGGSDAALSGALASPQGQPQFDGRLELASDNLRGLLSWLAIEPTAAPLERLNAASLTTGLRITSGLAEFANINLRLDGSTITGGAAYRLQQRPSFAVDLTIDRLNLDGYLSGAGAATETARQDTTTPSASPQSAGLAALDAFDANVKMRAGQLVYNRTPLKDVFLDATLAGGRLTLRQARAQAGGATLSASGAASGFADEPKFTSRLKLSADDLSGLAQFAGLRPAGGLPKLGGADLEGSLDGGFDAVAFAAEGALAGGRLKVDGKASNLQAAPSFSAKLDAKHADVVALVRDLGVDWRPAAPKLGGLTIKLAAEGGAEAVELPTLEVEAGPARLTGTARLDLGGPRPHLGATLAADDIVADLFLPAAEAGRGPAKGGAEGAASSSPRPGEPRWSREPLDLSALSALDADIELAARGLTFRAYPFREPRLALALKDGVLRIASLTGKLFDGAVALDGELASAPQPALSLNVKLDDADIRQALVTAMGIENVSGALDFSGAFRAAGRSEWDLVSSLEGEARLQAGEGVLRGVDLAALSQRLGELDGAAAFLDLAARSFSGGETRIRSASGTWQVKNGIATTHDTRAVLEAAEATLVGGVQLPAWRMDLRSEIALTEHPKAPPIGVTLSGPLDEPRREIRTEAMEQYLAARVGSELLRKGLGDKVKELGPLEGLLGGSRQPAPASPAQPQQQQPAPPPAQQAIEGLLKGLLKR